MHLKKYLWAVFFATAPLSAHVHASPPLIPLNQELAAVDYTKEGRQTGCGIRITAESGGDLWINVLLSVFVRETAPPLGMFKVVVKKINIENDEPKLQDGKIIYSSIGQIHHAWIKTASGQQLLPDDSAGATHGEGYMTSTEFVYTVDLLGMLMRENFSVGFTREEAGAEEVFEFNQRITPEESGKLTDCMKNLRATMEEKLNRESL
jgi:hypothetical protein